MSRLRPAAVAATAGALAFAALCADVTPSAASTTPELSASLEMSDATTWYAGGRFVVRNEGRSASDWRLTFRVPSGSFQNWASWMTTTEQDGDRVTIASTQPLAAGATADVSFGLTGDGSTVPGVESCTLGEATAVSGCSEDDPDEPSEPDEPGEPEEPADTTAPSAVGDLRTTSVGTTEVRLDWSAATDDHAVSSYEVRRRGADPVTTSGTSATVTDLAPGTGYRFEVVARDAAGNTGPGTTVDVTTAPEPVAPARLDVRADASTAPVQARGDAEQARAAEGRQFRHANTDPTGRFVTAGTPVRFDVPEGVTGLQAVVSLHGTYSGRNGGGNAGARAFDLHPGTNTVTAPIDGFVYLRDRSAAGSRTTVVTVTGGDAVATFVEGESDEATFERQVAEFDAPFAMLVGDDVMLEVQKPVLQRNLIDKGIDAAPRIRMIERFVAETDAVFGLDRTATGTAGRAPHRVLVTNPDDGAAYASATHDRITFHNRSGSMAHLLSRPPKDQWAFWHEVGHTYQPDWMNWSGLMEVSVNVPALANQELVNQGPVNRLDEQSAGIETFFRQPVDQRRFDEAGQWVRLLMFDQLRRAYGEDFFPRLAEQFRVERLLGAPVPSATDTDARKQQFALRAAQVAGQDLSGFFDAWGFGLTAETRQQLRRYPAPSFDISTNRHRPTDRVEHLVSRTVSDSTVTASGTAVWGQHALGDSIDADVTLADGTSRGRTAVVAPTIGRGTGRAVAEVVERDGSVHAYASAVDVRRGTMVSFLGSSDNWINGLALDPSRSRLSVAVTEHAAAHSRYGDAHYFGADLVAADGTTVASSTTRGKEYGYRFARELDGTEYRDGQYLVLMHREPQNRLQRWSEDTAIPQSSAVEQAFRIQGDALVPVPLSEVPGR
ncbi:hypothetical protein DEJ23_06410 [Curtobacterium sp. MCSS17_008]|uniref:M60 family metallopeptidase n=1 Tax=Curtobacterium sp. MCSS17_008 TaxID=2175647 RepID=UPI000DAA22D7|nr:M60 family metallopeptidase [Curtobacterium sp. MCSS17_008]PZF57769.1 hypothetical protein DEJ23_06410 [Curtobacterium sp. MCSS17_008]